MKKSQKLLITIGLGVLILMNVLVLGWVIIDFFSGSNEPEKTVVATEDWKDTTDAEPTEETSATASLPEVEQVFEDVKKPIHSWSVGSGQGEIGYSESASEKGPNDFTVEGNDICVLDVVNDRVLFHYGDGNDSYDSISNLQRVYSENGWNAVINYNGYYIDIYCREEKIADIDLRDSGIGKASEIISIDNTSVVFEALAGLGKIMKYRYDWSVGKLEELGKVSRPFYIEIDGNDAIILGEVGDKVYYWYRDGMENIIGVEVENVGRWYVTQELSGYHSVPADNLYVSKDGKLYLMECFNDEVVISELMLGEDVGTTDNGENSTEEPTTEEIPTVAHLPETEQVFEEVRDPIYNRYVGSGEYEIGYSVDEVGNLTGPDSFAIEGENLAILDGVNQRIYCDWDNYFYSRYISLKNIRYAVSKLSSIDESGVVFETSSGFRYRYDKTSDTVAPNGIVPKESSIKIGDQIATVIGKVGDRMYYQYLTGEGQDAKNVIGVVVENVGTWYVTQDLSGYRTIPSDNLYVSQNGKLYLMECFEDQTVISELMLGDPVEEPTEDSTEDSTKEPTPYDEVLDEYFAKREVLYTATEMPEIDPGWWEAVQEYMTSVGWNVLSAEMSYNIWEIISETETEVKLHLIEIAEITYVFDRYVKKEYGSISLEHIIRLSKQDGTYQIVADSCYHKMWGYQSGLEEDIKLLKPGASVAG